MKIHIEADSYFYTNQGVIVKLVNVLKQCDQIILVGKTFNKKFNLFEKPIRSSLININKAGDLYQNVYTYNIVLKKIVL